MNTKETAYLAHRKLSALQKLHISRRKRNLLKVHLPRQTYYALAPAETAIHAFGGLLQFLVLVLAKSRSSLVVADNAANTASKGV